MAVLSTKVPDATRLAFGLLAAQHRITPSALLRRLVERAHWLGGTPSDRVATLARKPADLDTLLDLLDLDRGANAEQIIAAVEAFLASLPADTPANAAPDIPMDPTAGTADAPQPAPLSRALAAKRETMTAVERDRFDRARASMARDRAAQLRARRAGTCPPFSPAVRAKLAKMTIEQLAKFDRVQANSWGARKGLR
jgi:hypothetical protein